MPLATLGPFALSAVGQSFTIIPAGQYSGPGIMGQLLLTNASGFTLQLFSSSQGQLPLLNAGEVTAIAAPSGGGSLTCTLIGGLNVPGTLYAQFGTDAETFQGDNATFPGAYPFAVPVVIPPQLEGSLPAGVPAGSDWTYTFGSGTAGSLVCVIALLTTSGVAANRQPFLLISTGGPGPLGLPMAPVSVTASTTAEFTGIIGLGPPYQCYGLITNFVFPLPESFAVGPTMTIASFTSNLQVGDQWSRIEIYLRNPA